MAKAKTMSKFEAVRRALDELGKDAMPQAIVDHLKSKYQIKISTSHVSNYKSKILKGGKKKRGRPRKESAAAATNGQEGHGRSTNGRRGRPKSTASHGSISIQD